MSATLKAVRLEAPSASGRKFYTIAIQSVEARQPFVTYTVDFVYGAVGGQDRTGTKTPQPVTLERAEEIFAALVKEKENGASHYKIVAEKLHTGIASTTSHNTDKQTGFAPVSSIPGRLLKDPEIERVCLPPRLLNDVPESMVLSLVHEDAWWVQIKHDGDRVQLHRDENGTGFFSGRSAKPRLCPAPVEKAFAKLAAHSVIVDGELVGDVLWIFDIFSFGGVDITNQPYEYRYNQIERFLMPIVGCEHVRLVHAAKTFEAKAQLILDARKNHNEGVVFVAKNSFYRAGRPNRLGDNLRLKFKASASVIVSAHNERRSVDVVLADGCAIGTVPIPPNKDIPAIGSVIEVEYLYCQTSLVQAVFKCVRTDVEHSACTRSQLQFKDGIDPVPVIKAATAVLEAKIPKLLDHSKLTPGQKAAATKRARKAMQTI